VRYPREPKTVRKLRGSEVWKRLSTFRDVIKTRKQGTNEW
jgi:hypothetical protein